MNKNDDEQIIQKKNTKINEDNEANYPMSRENLFKIRPAGLILKKRIVVDSSALNILLCNFFDAFKHTL